jgi:hypothetical protein
MQMNRGDRSMFDLPGGLLYGDMPGRAIFRHLAAARAAAAKGKDSMLYAAFGVHNWYRRHALHMLTDHGFVVDSYQKVKMNKKKKNKAFEGGNVGRSFADALVHAARHAYSASPKGWGVFSE